MAKVSLLLLMAAVVLFAGQSTLSAQQLQYAVSDPQAGNYGGPYSPNDQARPPIQPLGPGQLEQLVAPIALYPDALIAQVLAASTYPQQISEADSFRQEWGNASPDQIAAEADAQPWDPSVKALTAFPQVLAQMDRNLQWTTALGNAYYNQPEDVLEAVQVMRRRAQEAGNLRSSPQEVVRYDQGYIELAPPNPQVVYVPAYNPWTVYGEPISPYPGFSLLGVLGQIFGATPLRYGLGIAMAAFSNTPWGWVAWGLNWLTHALLFDHSDYYSHSNTVADWGFRHSGFHAYSGRGGFARSGAHVEVHGEGWRHGGFGANTWRSSTRGAFAGNRGEGWHSFSRGNTFAGNWRREPNGFQGFRGARAPNAGYGREGSNRVENNRLASAGFYHSPSNSFRDSRFGGQSFSARSSGSHFSSYGSSRGFAGYSGHQNSLRLTSGRSQKSFGGKGWGGFHSGGGGHAPKGFGGGKSFGGGHSRGGGHSGGHGGGGSRHHR